MKKSRFIVAISLMVQAVSFFILFLVYWARKKSMAGAFLALATLEGTAGGYLLYQLKGKKEDEEFDPSDYLDEYEEFDLDESMISTDLDKDGDGEKEKESVPTDESATEEEFK